MTISTEALLTHPSGFGIGTATPAQRAACRILDGRPIGELATHPDVLALVGGTDALARLPSERGVAPTEVVFLAAIRSAKTIIACAAAIRMTQTVDVSRLGPGEIPRVSLVSLKLDTSQVAYRLLTDTIRASKVLRPLLIGEPTAESILIRHPSGRAIEIACVAGAKAGGGLVARWSAGAVFDEAPRMSGAEDAVVNLSHARDAVIGRVLAGGQVLHVGSPHAPHGPIYDLVQEHWQKPTPSLVVLRGTGPMLNPQWWTPARCTQLEQTNPMAFRTDVCGEFADPEAGLINPVAIYRATRDGALELPYRHGARYFAAADPSEGAAGGNGFALCIVERFHREPELDLGPGFPKRRNDPNDPPRYRVVLAREWRGLSPGRCWSEIAKVLRGYRVYTARTDQYSASASQDLARHFGLRLTVDKATAASKLEDWTRFQTLMHNDAIELSPDPVLRRDLLSVKRRVTQSGSTIVLPRTSDGRHADLAAALCAAIAAASAPIRELQAAHIPGF